MPLITSYHGDACSDLMAIPLYLAVRGDCSIEPLYFQNCHQRAMVCVCVCVILKSKERKCSLTDNKYPSAQFLLSNNPREGFERIVGQKCSFCVQGISQVLRVDGSYCIAPSF